jgi:hypothetical protein
MLSIQINNINNDSLMNPNGLLSLNITETLSELSDKEAN